MWVSKISSLGAQAIKLMTRGHITSVPRNYNFHASAGGIQSLIWPQQKHRYFWSTAATNSSDDENEEKEMITVTFLLETDGTEVQAEIPVGTTMLEAAHAYDVDLEGACEGSCACSTCHLIVTDMSYYNKLPDALDEENDLLDLALGVTTTSRLGCQIKATPEIDGIRFAVPKLQQISFPL